VTDEVHLDIAHVSQARFTHPRQLRADPWLGVFLCYNPKMLYDTQHWFEFTQAAVAAQFYLPNYIIDRARPLAESARQAWFGLHSGQASSPEKTLSYLKALEWSANSIALLSGPPLTERRFLLNYPARAAAVDRPGLASGLVDLLVGDQNLPQEELTAIMDGWRQALAEAARNENCPPRLQSPRLQYYTRSAEALLPGSQAAALWLIMRTWTSAACFLGKESATIKSWQYACNTLGLDSHGIDDRLDTLDAYLDSVEETLDIWSQKNGI
jgi:hypothetical protein